MLTPSREYAYLGYPHMKRGRHKWGDSQAARDQNTAMHRIGKKRARQKAKRAIREGTY